MIYRFAVNNIEYGFVNICAKDKNSAREQIKEACNNGYFICNSNEIEEVGLDEICEDGKQSGDAYGYGEKQEI